MKRLPLLPVHVVASLLAWLSMAAMSFGEDPKAPARPAPLRALILSGAGDHDWKTTTPFLRQQMTASGRFDVRVCESPAGHHRGDPRAVRRDRE